MLPRFASKVALPEPYDTMTLPDGRTLSWAEVGDPSGEPLFYFHGMPGSRLAAFRFERVARRLGIDRYAVLGCSRGSPCALGCACVIPATTLSGVGLVSRAGPCEARPKKWRLPLNPFSFAYTPCPSLTAWVYGQLVGSLVRDTVSEAGREY